MEVNQENIEKVAKVLRKGKFDEAVSQVKNYIDIAKELIEKYPELTAEQIGEKYEQECENQIENSKNEEENIIGE